MAAGADRSTPEAHVYIVPVGERAENSLPGSGVCLAEMSQGLVRKHNSPAEGVIRRITLIDAHLPPGITLFHQQGEIKAGGSTAKTDDVERRLHEIPAFSEAG